MATPAGQAARSRRLSPMDRRAARGIPGERSLPWPQPASTAMICGRLLLAMTAVAGPSPVLPNPVSLSPIVTNPEVTKPFRGGLCRKEKSERCDLLHKRAGLIALNVRNGRKKLPIIVRSDSRHRHRLRLDSGRRCSDPDCADLSHFDLNRRSDRGSAGPPLGGYARAAKGSVRPHFWDVPFR